MLKNFGQMMKQAQEMQARIAEMQERLSSVEVTGSSGAGMVTVTMSAKGEARGLSIDPSLIKEDEKEVLEDLIIAAVNDAKSKAEVVGQEEMQKLTGGLQLPPGFEMPKMPF